MVHVKRVRKSGVWVAGTSVVLVFFCTVLLMFSGCKTTDVETPLRPGNRYFVLAEPLTLNFPEDSKNRELALPPGRYQCYFKDDGAYYYEAPYSSREDTPFRESPGGVMVTRSEPREAYLYGRDNHMRYTYLGLQVGLVPVGGTGRYIQGSRIGDEIFDKIKFVVPED